MRRALLSCALSGVSLNAPSSDLSRRNAHLIGADPAALIAHRAWWLLRLLCGQVGNDAHNASSRSPTPLSLDLAFLAWLVDSDHATAAAFWKLLAHLRQSRVWSSILRGIDGAMPQAGLG